VSADDKGRQIARAAREYYDRMSGKRRRKRQSAEQMAQQARDQARDIRSVAKLLKRIDPVYRESHGGTDITMELEKRADFLNSLSKNGSPLDIHKVIAISICLAGLRILYGNRNWRAIGEKTVRAFGGVVAAKDPASWARKTFYRYRKLMRDKSFPERAMKDGFIRKLRGSDEAVIMSPDYFEKIHGYRPPGSTLLAELREAMGG
jgi:hypothetical protein